MTIILIACGVLFVLVATVLVVFACMLSSRISQRDQD